MVFNSIAFIIFFAIFYISYLLIRKRRHRTLLILIGSYIFYGWWDWRFLSLILLSTVVDYSIGKRIFRETSKKKRKKLLIISITTNLGLLFFFKYFNFFIDSFVDIATAMGMSPSFHTLKIILPVGISFYTFQTLSYTIDIYNKKLNPEPNFAVFAAYVAFFPQLVAGPIVRAIDLLPQFKLSQITSAQIRQGIFLIILGYFKKVVLADSLAPLVDAAFANPLNYTSLNMVIVVLFYSFQIYCDFSGYSDIAIGLGKMMGFDFPQNFNLPYLSKNFSDFWNRWHISLSSWLRDYLYIPLGGNRVNSIFTLRNLIITMLLGGLWHGANWTFIAWGLLHGTYLIFQRLLRPATDFLEKNFSKSLITVLGIMVTFLFINIAWIFFRSQTITEAFQILDKISSFDNMSISALKPKFQISKAFLLITLLFFSEISYFLFENEIKMILRKKRYIQLFINAFLLWMILLFGTFSNNNFIYFQF